MDSEKDLLLNSLDGQREHVVGILDGLSTEALQRSVLPSGWTSVGLVNHLALDVERFWFREVVAGEIFHEQSDNEIASAWSVAPGATPGEVIARYHREIELANQIVKDTSLDDPPRTWPEFFGDWRLPNVRAVLVHVIAETATHAGHLDAVRELIDGRTWLRVT